MDTNILLERRKTTKNLHKQRLDSTGFRNNKYQGVKKEEEKTDLRTTNYLVKRFQVLGFLGCRVKSYATFTAVNYYYAMKNRQSDAFHSNA
jgi:hypothetical protein